MMYLSQNHVKNWELQELWHNWLKQWNKGGLIF
jgi:hypothetical protein